jgi:hypothetical protein
VKHEENQPKPTNVFRIMRADLLATEDWARLAVAIGYDPTDVEGQGRDILKRLSAMGVKPVTNGDKNA